ncbi:Mitochondrial import inner membrane translocase subunit TIM14 [Blattella germanica]|nr:Mitochondrial import inner membrane translocase subunit TIM14 [Blattella germanica]
MSHRMNEAMKAIPKLDPGSFANSKYYKGGFEHKMTRREASLILGISPTASKIKIKVSSLVNISFSFPRRFQCLGSTVAGKSPAVSILPYFCYLHFHPFNVFTWSLFPNMSYSKQCQYCTYL